MFYSRHLSVCLSVCLLATLRKNYWHDLRENFLRDVSVDKEVPIKFRKSSASEVMIRITDPDLFGLGGCLLRSPAAFVWDIFILPGSGLAQMFSSFFCMSHKFSWI